MLLIGMGVLMVMAGTYNLLQDRQRDQITDQAWMSQEIAVDSGSDSKTTPKSLPQTPHFDVAPYTVVAGDSWWSIAQDQLQDPYQYRSLAHFNDLETVTPLEIDQQIVIPSPETFTAWKEAGEPDSTAYRQVLEEQTVTTAAEPENTEYVVQAGDSLWSIAQTELGDGYQWKSIQLANNIDNPGMISPGDTLLVPTSQAAAVSLSVP